MPLHINAYIILRLFLYTGFLKMILEPKRFALEVALCVPKPNLRKTRSF